MSGEFRRWTDRRDGEVRKVLYTPEQFANLAEGFCPFARIHATGETEAERDARLVPTEDGWLRCTKGGEYWPVSLVEAPESHQDARKGV